MGDPTTRGNNPSRALLGAHRGNLGGFTSPSVYSYGRPQRPGRQPKKGTVMTEDPEKIWYRMLPKDREKAESSRTYLNQVFPDPFTAWNHHHHGKGNCKNNPDCDFVIWLGMGDSLLWPLTKEEPS